MISLLYVDDEPDLLALGKLYLERGGEFSVSTADCAQDGLARLSTTTFDAIISDYQMPDMDGIAFLKQVRLSHGTLPFILFTGRGREEVVIEAINNGADFYLQKGGAPKAQFAELKHKLHIAIERRRAVDALRAENEKNKSLMDYASDAIVIVDVETGLIVDANKKALEITGRSPELIRTQSYLSLHPPQYHDEYRTAFGTVIGQGTGSMMTIILTKTGKQVPMYVSATTLEIAGRHCLMGIFRDMADIHMTQEALQLANRKLNLLADITRHDIRNKLTVIGGYLDLIKDRPPEPDYSMYLKKVRSTVRVIGENIEFTKLYQNLGVAAPSWQNVHDAFFKACSHLDIRRISVQSDTRGLEIFADPLLERAFYNFVENSVQHGGNVTVIRISATTTLDGDMILSIEDDGTGIPPFEKISIFSKGYGRNTGLGLFLVKEILSITGISLKETGEYHKGARFELRVPEGAYRFPQRPDTECCHILMPSSPPA
ncbi:MAG: response regulator [Methanomicrobiales archaeon]|nr:response regulator [Methanomicrobiales archaeon]